MLVAERGSIWKVRSETEESVFLDKNTRVAKVPRRLCVVNHKFDPDPTIPSALMVRFFPRVWELKIVSVFVYFTSIEREHLFNFGAKTFRISI